MDADDTLTDDLAREAAYRERATVLLDEVAQRGREVLLEAGIPLNIFFVVPPSGDAILSLGAIANKEEWQDIRAIVSRLVQHSIGLDPVQCRQVICAMSYGDDATP